MSHVKTGRPARGRLLERVRRHFKLSQRRMAKAMGVDQATLNQWETGGRPMPVARLDTLLVMLMEAPQDPIETPRLLQAIKDER